MSSPIIITVPTNYLVEDSKVGIVQPSMPLRKRKLDHLSWEEKMQRKKLKNRVAAQTSRDRKKAKMDEMEIRIQHLEEVNQKLTTEMASLKALNERLLGENTSLREAAARSVEGAPRPAEGRAPCGTPSGASAADDVPLADLIAHLDSDEYLDTLNQLAESLLKEIDAGSTESVEVRASRQAEQPPEAPRVVGTTAEHVEPSEGVSVDKKDIDRIMLQHSYAHPYHEENNDKGDMFYADEANDCVTVEVPCEDEEMKPITIKTDFEESYPDVSFACDMKLLSPMTLSPQSIDSNGLAVSPAHTFSSDLGYESLASPLSEVESLDLSDFWCDSLSELFPGLV